MKNIIFIAITIIGLQVAAQEQHKDHQNFNSMSAEQIATKKTENMATLLGLDNSQKKAIYALNLKDAKLIKAKIESEKTRDKTARPSVEDQKRTKKTIEKNIADKQARLKKILTEEQFAKLKTHNSVPR